MRRLLAALMVSTVVAATAAALGPAASADALPPDDAPRGLVHQGLKPALHEGTCGDGFQLARLHRGREKCTHGPDPAPPGVDVRSRRDPGAPGMVVAGPGGTGARAGPEGTPHPGTAAAGPATVQCYGDGASGPRVQLVYARAADRPDRYSDFLPTFGQIGAQIDNAFVASAAETGGSRHVRFVTDSSCAPVVSHVVLSAGGDDNIDATISDLEAQGYTRSDRKYLVWVDANVYCGIAEVYDDDRAIAANYNNGNAAIPGMVARVDNGCWGLSSNLVEAHELMHNLGGVQTSAPHATSRNHCTDDFDRMCYNDGSGQPVSVVCPSSAHEALFDCNHDDYFSTSSSPPTYLKTHWNAANSVFLASGGSASAWGYNGVGSVGDGTTTGRPSPVALPGLTGILAVAAGIDHSLAVQADGTVLAWGGNAYGQLGDGTTTTRLTPVPVPGLTGVTAVAGGAYHSLALRSDGTVWAWGLNALGELGDGTTTQRPVPVPVPGLTGVVGVTAGLLHSVAVRSDGTVWAWGWNVVGQLGDNTTTDRWVPVQVPGLTGIKAVAAGAYHTLALRSDGTMRAWGWNGLGQLGDGTTIERHAPVAVAGVVGVAGVAAGYYHSVAFTTTGAVGAWGWNGVGQLGDGTTTNRVYAVAVAGLSSGVTAVSAGGYHTLATTGTGAVAAWGWNDYGQLGDGTTTLRVAPTAVKGPVTAFRLAGGGVHSLVA